MNPDAAAGSGLRDLWTLAREFYNSRNQKGKWEKPWMNKDVRLLLKARNTAFRSGDAQAYSTARADLKRGIKQAKHCYKLKVEEHFSNSNRVISDYKPANTSPPPSSDTSFLNELNNFYARFEKDNHEPAKKAELNADHRPLTLSPIDVEAELHSVLSHLDNTNTYTRMC